MFPSKQPSIAALTARSLAARTVSRVSDDMLEVEPHEALTGIRIDAQAAWIDAQLPLSLLGVAVGAEPAPADWSSFVNRASGRLGIPMAAGHFPQRLRNVAGLFAADLIDAPIAQPTGFARQVALGSSPAGLNERAADLWCEGQRQDALAIWESMAPSAVKSFNIGMAELMLGRTDSAQLHLAEAIAKLPETSGWSQLAALYLTVAQISN